MDFSVGKRLRELPGPLLLTGHTGFKGTWTTLLLEHLGVSTVGYSLPAERDSLFDRANRKGAIPELFADIRSYQVLEEFMDRHKPSTIIHMAAQPLVLKSYESPRETFDVNVMGTTNVLDIAFKKDYVQVIVIVTTDKVYRNDNSSQPFVETDPLEGKDPYSSSKVGTEAAVTAWQQISKISGGPKVVSVRAGNVIGGGDYAENRIIPDLIRGVFNNAKVEIRNPRSTRPWQHVLDPIHGYLLALEKSLGGSSFSNLNFGPSGRSLSVMEIVEIGSRFFPQVTTLSHLKGIPSTFMEATFLDLDSSLSQQVLDWSPHWSQEQAAIATFEWWSRHLAGTESAEKLCKDEIRALLRE